MTHKYNMNEGKGIWQEKKPMETMSNDKLLQKVLILIHVPYIFYYIQQMHKLYHKSTYHYSLFV
jgi:hypothetical protein